MKVATWTMKRKLWRDFRRQFPNMSRADIIEAVLELGMHELENLQTQIAINGARATRNVACPDCCP